MKRVLIIDKCQDCNVENCKNRTMCGLIPDECQLNILVEETQIPSWDDAPHWANWLTYDQDDWYWWQDMPDFYDGVYIPKKDSDSPLKADFPIPENTTSAIYSRPQKEVKK